MEDTVVLCADPDGPARETTRETLQRESDGVEVVGEGSVEAAKESLREHPVDCVVTEYELSDATGLDLVEHVRTTMPDVGCILYTTTDRRDIADESSDEMILEYVEKGTPGADEQLVQLVRTTAQLSTQTAYPLPDDEADRLAALEAYDFDADALEADVGRITDLAARHFDVSRSSANIIEEHEQSFLTCHGAEWNDTNREDSICTYAILDDSAVTTIEDTMADPRFEHNQNLRDIGIRSYMGAPLTTDDGLAIGTLCVYDEQPRTFTTSEERYLQTLADVAMNLIALHGEVGRATTDSETVECEGDAT